jgi:hypothetical protein
MAGNSVSVVDVLQCPHGGTVQIIPANPRVLVNGAPLATIADTFLISGCPFQIPATPPIPSPCLTVQWSAADQRTKVNGVSTVSQSSQGLCMGATGAPQGPVVIVSTQTRAHSQEP